MVNINAFEDDAPVRILETGPAARPDDGPTVAVAEITHFRRTGEDTTVLYHEGDHILAAHRDAEAVPAELIDGVYWPATSAPKKASKR